MVEGNPLCIHLYREGNQDEDGYNDTTLARGARRYINQCVLFYDTDTTTTSPITCITQKKKREMITTNNISVILLLVCIALGTQGAILYGLSQDGIFGTICILTTQCTPPVIHN